MKVEPRVWGSINHRRKASWRAEYFICETHRRGVLPRGQTSADVGDATGSGGGDVVVGSLEFGPRRAP